MRTMSAKGETMKRFALMILVLMALVAFSGCWAHADHTTRTGNTVTVYGHTNRPAEAYAIMLDAESRSELADAKAEQIRAIARFMTEHGVYVNPYGGANRFGAGGSQMDPALFLLLIQQEQQKAANEAAQNVLERQELNQYLPQEGE
jgi:hypothetical protein